MMKFNTHVLDDLAARIGKAIESSPAKDVEKNVKALLQSGLARLDLVSRQEFDTQAQVLLRTREKLEKLEARIAELEQALPAAGASSTTSASTTKHSSGKSPASKTPHGADE